MGLSGSALTGVDAKPAVYPPSTGTAILADDVKAGEQALLNHVTSLELGGEVVNIEDRTMAMIWTGTQDVTALDYWTPTAYGSAQQIPAPIGALTLAMQVTQADIPHGATVTAIAAIIDPAAHGSAPQFLPTLTFVKIAQSTGVATTIGTVTDTWNGGAYSSAHTLAILSLSEVMNWDLYRYALLFQSEYGSNSQAGLVVIHPRWTGTARSNRVNEDP